MIKLTGVKDLDLITDVPLRDFMNDKMTGLLKMYSLTGFENIGCFIVLEKDEETGFIEEEMEFTEMLTIGDNEYIHGVRITGTEWAEDIYMCNDLKSD